MIAPIHRKAHGGTCGARNRSGGLCKQRAGFGTSHFGRGRCKFHGGATPIKHGVHSTVHTTSIRDLAEHFEKNPDPLNILSELALMRALVVDFVNRWEEMRDALLAWHGSFTPEYKRERALEIQKEAEIPRRELQETIESLDRPPEGKTWPDVVREAFEMGLEIRERSDPLETLERPKQVLDVSDARALISEVTKIVARIHKFQSENAISQADFYRIMMGMGQALETHVRDERILARIRDDWLALRI